MLVGRTALLVDIVDTLSCQAFRRCSLPALCLRHASPMDAGQTYAHPGPTSLSDTLRRGTHLQCHRWHCWRYMTSTLATRISTHPSYRRCVGPSCKQHQITYSSHKIAQRGLPPRSNPMSENNRLAASLHQLINSTPHLLILYAGKQQRSNCFSPRRYSPYVPDLVNRSRIPNPPPPISTFPIRLLLPRPPHRLGSTSHFRLRQPDRRLR